MERKRKLQDQGRLRTKKFRLKRKLKSEHERSVNMEDDFDNVEESLCADSSSDRSEVMDISECSQSSQSNNSEGNNQEESSVDFIEELGQNLDDARRNEIPAENFCVVPENDDTDDTDNEYNNGDEDIVIYHYEMRGESSEGSSSEDDFDNVDEVADVPEYNPPPEIEQLRELGQRMNQKNLDILLRILRERLLPTLPKSSKTFLRTIDARYNIIEMRDCKEKMGQFVYFSIKKGLEDSVNPAIHKENKIDLIVSCDGLPLSKSGDGQFWVTSAKVHFNPDVYEVFPIAIFFGQSKPNSVEEYLEQFVEEINQLNRDGVNIEGRHFEFNLKSIICDTPARAFLKCTLGHGGKEGCERCEIVGERVEGRTVYPSTDEAERTNDSFRIFRQARHHHGPSPLLQILPFINIVSIFVLDFMHLFCCGIMRKLLDYWLNGSLNCRLNVGSRLELGRRLEYIKSQIPDDFQRKTRSVAYFAKWKATELRLMLLYVGPIVLKNLLPENLYNHFLPLHVAARILCSDSLCNVYREHAKLYLRSFFIAMRDYYGAASQILNAHHLIHVADDVLSMGCSLSRISAFPFESFLGKIKRKLRTSHQTLAQLCRRLHEERVVVMQRKVTIPPPLSILKTDRHGNITKIMYKDTIISISPPNNTVILTNNKIVSIKKLFEDNGILRMQCQIWKKDKPLYTYPTNSEILNMWKLHYPPTNKIINLPVASISQKLIKLQLSFTEDGPEKVYVVPLLH